MIIAISPARGMAVYFISSRNKAMARYDWSASVHWLPPSRKHGGWLLVEHGVRED